MWDLGQFYDFITVLIKLKTYKLMFDFSLLTATTDLLIQY